MNRRQARKKYGGTLKIVVSMRLGSHCCPHPTPPYPTLHFCKGIESVAQGKEWYVLEKLPCDASIERKAFWVRSTFIYHLPGWKPLGWNRRKCTMWFVPCENRNEIMPEFMVHTLVMILPWELLLWWISSVAEGVGQIPLECWSRRKVENHWLKLIHAA